MFKLFSWNLFYILKKIIRIVLSNESDLMKYTICKTDFLTLRVHRIKREAVLIFIYSMMVLLICKYESFWQEVMVESLILRWSLRPVGLLFMMYTSSLLQILILRSAFMAFEQRGIFIVPHLLWQETSDFEASSIKIVIFSRLLQQVRTGDLF